MACWKCDGDHSPMDCRKWPGFSHPPDRIPPSKRTTPMTVAPRKVDRVIVIGPEPAPTVPRSVLTKVKAAVEKAERKFLAPPGECKWCDARRSDAVERMRKRRGKQAGVPR